MIPCRDTREDPSCDFAAPAAGAFVTWGLEGDFVLLPGVALGTAAAGAAIAIAVGLAGTWRALGQKPAPLLRNE